MALGKTCLDSLGVIVSLIEAVAVGHVDFHGDESACLSHNGEFLMASGFEGVFGTFASPDEAGLGEDGSIGGLTTYSSGTTHFICLVIDIFSCRKTISKGFFEHEMTVEGWCGKGGTLECLEIHSVAGSQGYR